MALAEQLNSLSRQKAFFVGIDSDGCAFGSMEIKHRECFIPNLIACWDLNAVADLARETWEFVNLHSRQRGVNRFVGLVMTLDMLAARPEAIERGFKCPPIDSLRHWLASGTALANGALAKLVNASHDAALARALEWSEAVNADVARVVRNVPPFPYVRQSLEKLQPLADIVVVSAASGEALRREWQEHDLARFTRVLCGQEAGSKSEQLKHAAAGKYDAGQTLMVGDAPGDMAAARENDALFFPINPGKEANSWKRFHDEGIERFQSGKFRGAYENDLVEEFMLLLPELPPWRK